MNIFRKKGKEITWPVELEQLELVSIHVEKAAGTSFFHVLKKVYGDKHVVRIDTHQHGKIAINQSFDLDLTALKQAKVIHGHFTKSDLEKYFILPRQQEIPHITWLRNPTERVLSSYNHLSQRLKEYVNSQESPDLISKTMKSFTEFVASPYNQNKIHQYLGEFDLNTFAFIGQVEQFQKDLNTLAEKLNWNLSDIDNNKLNQSIRSKELLNQEEIDLVKKHNSLDYQIWNKYQ